ncbi:MAG: hypothetical protein MHM6MM_002038 [Cercozoa sp. M6MM]
MLLAVLGLLVSLTENTVGTQVIPDSLAYGYEYEPINLHCESFQHNQTVKVYWDYNVRPTLLEYMNVTLEDPHTGEVFDQFEGSYHWLERPWWYNWTTFPPHTDRRFQFYNSFREGSVVNYFYRPFCLSVIPPPAPSELDDTRPTAFSYQLSWAVGKPKGAYTPLFANQNLSHSVAELYEVDETGPIGAPLDTQVIPLDNSTVFYQFSASDLGRFFQVNVRTHDVYGAVGDFDRRVFKVLDLPVPISFDSVIQLDYFHVQFSWTPATDPNKLGQGTTRWYEIWYRDVTLGTPFEILFLSLPGPTTIEHRVPHCEHVYEFKLHLWTEGYMSPTGDIVSMRMLSDRPDDIAVTKIIGTREGTEKVTLEVQVAIPDDPYQTGGVPIQNCTVILNSPSHRFDMTAAPDALVIHSVPRIEFNMFVRCTNQAGKASFWTYRRHKVTTDAPVPPELTLTNAAPAQARFTWSRMHDTGGARILGYNVRYRCISLDSRWVSTFLEEPSKYTPSRYRTSVAIDGLHDMGLYEFVFSVRTEEYQGIETEVLTMHVEGVPPGVPKLHHRWTHTERRLLLEWANVMDTAGRLPETRPYQITVWDAYGDTRHMVLPLNATGTFVDGVLPTDPVLVRVCRLGRFECADEITRVTVLPVAPSSAPLPPTIDKGSITVHTILQCTAVVTALLVAVLFARWLLRDHSDTDIRPRFTNFDCNNWWYIPKLPHDYTSCYYEDDRVHPPLRELDHYCGQNTPFMMIM